MTKRAKSERSIDPLDLGERARHLDFSGSPAGLVELARRLDDLLLLDQVGDDDVLIEYPMGERWQQQTGHRRFVRLRQPIDGRRHALVEPL